jgi:hypothetical protein
MDVFLLGQKARGQSAFRRQRANLDVAILDAITVVL